MVPGAEADGTVEEFPDDVGVSGMPERLGRHVHQRPVEGHLVAIGRPPRHPSDGVQRKTFDRRVRMTGRLPVQPEDVVPGLVRGGPHVGVGLDIRREPRSGLGKGRPNVTPKYPPRSWPRA